MPRDSAVPRVLHVNDCLDVGGAEVMILKLLDRLQSMGLEVAVCPLSRDGVMNPQFEAAGIPIFELPKKDGIDYLLILRIFMLLIRKRIRIVHTHNYYTWFYAGLAARLLPGVVHVHTQHSNIVMAEDPPGLLKSILSRAPAEVIAVSDAVLETLRRRHFIADGVPAQVIYNGVETLAEGGREGAGRAQEKVIGIVARLAPVKNHGLLIRAFARLSAQHPDALLEIVGDGPSRQELEGLAEKLLPNGQVRFIGEQQDVSVYLARWSIFALSSVSEGLPMSILEAMAQCLPVVATDVGGVSRVVRDGETGLLVKTEDEVGLAAALAGLLDDPERGRRLGRNGFQLVQAEFSLDAMARNYYRVYQRRAALA